MSPALSPFSSVNSIPAAFTSHAVRHTSSTAPAAFCEFGVRVQRITILANAMHRSSRATSFRRRQEFLFLIRLAVRRVSLPHAARFRRESIMFGVLTRSADLSTHSDIAPNWAAWERPRRPRLCASTVCCENPGVAGTYGWWPWFMTGIGPRDSGALVVAENIRWELPAGGVGGLRGEGPLLTTCRERRACDVAAGGLVLRARRGVGWARVGRAFPCRARRGGGRGGVGSLRGRGLRGSCGGIGGGGRIGGGRRGGLGG